MTVRTLASRSIQSKLPPPPHPTTAKGLLPLRGQPRLPTTLLKLLINYPRVFINNLYPSWKMAVRLFPYSFIFIRYCSLLSHRFQFFIACSVVILINQGVLRISTLCMHCACATDRFFPTFSLHLSVLSMTTFHGQYTFIYSGG